MTTNIAVTRKIGLAIAALIFVLDQLTKWYVTGPLGLNQVNDSLTLLPIFDLRFVKNVGISLGLLAANSDMMRWALVALTAAIATGVAIWMMREEKLGEIVGLGLVLGGALGNIVDRARFGYVVDFADLHFGTWRPFLIFNVADAAITIGVVIILFRALLVRDNKPSEANSAAVEK